MSSLSTDSITTASDESRLVNESFRRPVNLVEKLDASDLDDLKHYFYSDHQNHGKIVHDIGFDDVGEHQGVPLTKEAFTEAVFEVIGHENYKTAAESFFENLVTVGIIQNGFIWWENVLQGILHYEVDEDHLFFESQRIQEKQHTLIRHCKSPIVKVLLPETPHSSCYVVVSLIGTVVIYDEKLTPKEQYRISLRRYKAGRISYVTDAIIAQESNTLIVSTSNRTLHFYNTSKIVHTLLFEISSLPNVPTCLHYSACDFKKSLLVIGDDKGCVTSFHFEQPNKSFFRPKHKKGRPVHLWTELQNQKEWVSISITKNIHAEQVERVEYFRDNKTIVSCSTDPVNSLVVKYVEGKRSSYVYSIDKGVRKFHLDKRLGLMATVSFDHVVRLWNPVVVKEPMLLLEGHEHRVVDVCLLKHAKSILSFSDGAVLKVWDFESHFCIQTLHLDFPRTVTSKSLNFNAIYPGIRQIIPLKDSNKVENSSNTERGFLRDPWMRAELVVVYGNYFKVIKLNCEGNQVVSPLPLPRKNLEPAVPTPYYPVTHTFRENTKLLKQRMFKNLATLAPFYEIKDISALDFSYECCEDIREMKKFVKHGVPHLGLTLKCVEAIDSTTFSKAQKFKESDS